MTTDIDTLVALGEGITPGPWEHRIEVNAYGLQDDAAPILGTIMAGGTWHIAVLPSDLKESGANARAIAAVPDLIAAIRTLQTEKAELRDCLQQFVNGVETHMIDSPADDILANITNRARQALSNTGEME